MIVDTYSVSASSQRTYLSIEQTTFAGRKELLLAPEEKEKEGAKPAKDEVSISDAVKDMYKKAKEDSDRILEKAIQSQAPTGISGPKMPRNPAELKLSLLEMMLELMTGKKIKLKLFDPEEEDGQPIIKNWMPELNMPSAPQGAPIGRVVDTMEFTHFSYESESISYQAQATVNTADGRSISVDISMSMSREFMSYTNVSMQLARPCDPLVINYGGTAASLTGETFEFDLTMNGSMEKLSMLGQGSGFLAVDWNGDGKINDGRELFGPRTGDGFSELRAYDVDKNGWIDEADPIFSKLVIWSKDKDGNDQIFTLKELGIGAIFLGDLDTQYSFKDDVNNTTGIMRSTSFFLKENGGAGTVSHVDMMV